MVSDRAGDRVMNLLFVTWAGGGNSTPVLGIATRLIAQGHEVKVVSPDDSTARFAAVNVPYEVLPAEPHAVLAAIERLQPDLVIVDFMMTGWLSDAEASGVPSVALVHTLYGQVIAGIMTAFTSLDAINAGRKEIGLDALTAARDLLDRMTRVLVTSFADLEDESLTFGANVRHVGAILEEPHDDEGWTPPPTGGAPLVVASLGTTPGLDDHVVLPTFLDAVAELPVHAVINAGAHLDVDRLRPPDNVTIAGYVRHAAVMPHASAVVTHGCLGVTLAALCHGQPMVAIPLGRDQPATARRVVAVGAGIALPVDAPPSEMRGALEAVLEEPSYRTAAQRFAEQYDPTASAAIAALESISTRR
jgi:MGT family glycosyltransferase